MRFGFDGGLAAKAHEDDVMRVGACMPEVEIDGIPPRTAGRGKQKGQKSEKGGGWVGGVMSLGGSFRG